MSDKHPIYLDYSATTPVDERVAEKMCSYLTREGVFGNPASRSHAFGWEAEAAVEEARKHIADLVGANPKEIVFTSGATESDNLAIKGVAHFYNRDGRVTPDTLEQAILPDTRLVSVMSANNETGVIQDIASLAEIAARKNIWFHTDASQAAGKIDVSFKDWGVHAMTLSAHKLYGPTGAGALLVDKRLPLHALMHGGAQEHRLRAGTENVAAIAGFGAAAAIAKKELNERAVHALHLREALEQRLAQIPQATVFAQNAQRLPNTVQFGIRGFDGETLLMQLDRMGIAVSSGSACTSGKTEPSHVLKAMGVPEELALSSVRVSFGKDNTVADAEKLLQALGEIIDTTSKSAVMMAANV